MPRGTPMYTLERALAHPSLAVHKKRIGMRRINSMKAGNTKARAFTLAQARDMIEKELAEQAWKTVPRHPPTPPAFPMPIKVTTSPREAINVRAAMSTVRRGARKVITSNRKRAAEWIKNAADKAKQFIDRPEVQEVVLSTIEALCTPRTLVIAIGATVVVGAVLWMTGCFVF